MYPCQLIVCYQFPGGGGGGGGALRYIGGPHLRYFAEEGVFF